MSIVKKSYNEHLCANLCMVSFLLGVKLLCQIKLYVWHLERLSEYFFKWHHFTAPLAMHVESNFAIAIPTLIIVSNYSHPSGYELVLHLVLICCSLMTMMLRAFSRAYWSFVYPLWKMTYLDLLCMNLSLYYWGLKVIYIF